MARKGKKCVSVAWGIVLGNCNNGNDETVRREVTAVRWSALGRGGMPGSALNLVNRASTLWLILNSHKPGRYV